MSEPLIPFVKLPEIPLSFLAHVPLLGEYIDASDPPSIKPFGTLVALGVYLGTSQAMRRARERGYDPRLMSDYLFWAVATGFVVSHILDAVFYHPATVARNPLYLLKIWDGLSSYGGFVGAVIGSLAWKYYRRQKVLGYIDLTVSGMPLAWVLGRAGCSVVHDHPGILSNHLLAVRFPPRALAADVEWIYWGPPYVGRLDLGLLEMLLTIPLAIAVAVLWRRERHRPDGYYIAVVCMAYPPVRFLLDFLRVGPESAVLGADPRYGGLTPAQWAGFALFVTAVVVFLRMRKLPPTVAVPATAAEGAGEGASEPPSARARPSGPPAQGRDSDGGRDSDAGRAEPDRSASGSADDVSPGDGAPPSSAAADDDPPSVR